MKKKEFLAGAALLSISSAVCLKIMKKVGEKLKKEKKRKKWGLRLSKKPVIASQSADWLAICYLRRGSSRGQSPPRIESNVEQSLALQGVRGAKRLFLCRKAAQK